jgi:hypothetical protein
MGTYVHLSSHREENGIAYRVRTPWRRTPHSSRGRHDPPGSMGKPGTRRRGNLRNQARALPLTKERRGGVIEFKDRKGTRDASSPQHLRTHP